MNRADIKAKLKAFIKSGKATSEVNSGNFVTTHIDPLKIAEHFYGQAEKDIIDEGERIGREMGEKLGKQLGEIIVEGLKEEYKKGYEQAQKDLELSWRDIQHIVKIADHLCNSLEYDKIKKMGEEGYYTEILERFNKEKYGNTQE